LAEIKKDPLPQNPVPAFAVVGHFLGRGHGLEVGLGIVARASIRFGCRATA